MKTSYRFKYSLYVFYMDLCSLFKFDKQINSLQFDTFTYGANMLIIDNYTSRLVNLFLFFK